MCILFQLPGNKAGAVVYGLEALGNYFMGGKTNEEARRKTELENQSEADVIQFGGCLDDQTSADAKINGQNSGAMTWAFLTALTQNPNQDYASLLKNMRQLLRGRYTQLPQISTSHRVNLFTPFNM